MFRRLSAAAVTVLALAAGAAHARGQLQAKQTGIELAPDSRAGRLVLANTGDAPLAAQVRVYAWTQEGQEDQLTPSQALMPSPAKSRQAASNWCVWSVQTRASPAASWLTGSSSTNCPAMRPQVPAAVSVRMRFLIPAFVRSVDPAPVNLRCRLESAALSCDNTGGRAAQLGASRLLDGAGRSVEITQGLLGYVLAGSSRRWPLDSAKLKAIGAAAKLEVRLNGQPATIELQRAP